MAITKVLYDFNQGMALAPWQRESHEGRRNSLSEFLRPVSRTAGGNAQKPAEMQCFKGFELLLTDPTDFIAFFTIFHNAFSATVEVSKAIWKLQAALPSLVVGLSLPGPAALWK